MIYAFARQHQDEFPVQLTCEVLGVSVSGYYAWLDRPQSVRAARRAALLEKIQRVHVQHRRVYGSPRVYKALKAQGEKMSLNTIASIMKTHGIRPKSHKRFRVKTTDSNHINPIAPNTLNREFDVKTINFTTPFPGGADLRAASAGSLPLSEWESVHGFHTE